MREWRTALGHEQSEQGIGARPQVRAHRPQHGPADGMLTRSRTFQTMNDEPRLLELELGTPRQGKLSRSQAVQHGVDRKGMPEGVQRNRDIERAHRTWRTATGRRLRCRAGHEF